MINALLTSWRELRKLARGRGIPDPRTHDVWCGKCGAPMGIFGLAHWPDCDADESDIQFKPRSGTTSAPRRSQ